MFEKATRLRIRFNTPQGQLSVEDLWDLPLTSTTNKANLDDIAKSLRDTTQKSATESFVLKTTSVKDATIQLAFEVVKHIIDVRLAERDKAEQAKVNKEKKMKIMSIIESKQDELLKGTPLDELLKMVDGL